METRETVRSRIQLTFEGMMVLFVKDGAEYCDVGLIKHAPNHVAHLLITKIPEIGAPETILHLHDAQLDESRLWLDVQKTGTRIRLYTNGDPHFDRKSHVDDRDFRWRVDFPDLYGGTIAHDKNAFRLFLRINDGTFYTQQKSENQLVLKKPGKDPETIGKVAVKLRSEIELAGEDVAYFSNGTGTSIPLPAQRDVDYGIYLGLVRHDHSASHSLATEDIDAEHYYTAMAIDKPPSRKIHFDRDDHRATPDAVCFPPTSNPPGF